MTAVGASPRCSALASMNDGIPSSVAGSATSALSPGDTVRTATIGIRSGVFPRWFALVGYLVLGVVLLVAVSFVDGFILVLPAWVVVASLFILRRERARR